MLTRRQFNKLVLSSILFSSFGCTSLRKKDFEEGILRLNLGFEPDTLDWAKATDSYSFDVIANIMVGLTKYNNNLKSIPSLAKSWDLSDDGKTYTFHLDKNARWTDDKPVLAQDFEYGWKRILNPQTAAPYAYLLYPVKNAQAYNTGNISNPNQIGVKALDDFTFQVELESPLAFFLNLTSWAVCFPQRKDIIEKFGDDWTEPKNIVTCGPFKLDKWQHEYKVTLSKNPLYKNPEPKINGIKYFIVPEQSSGFSLFMNNEIDSADSRSIPISEIETIRKMKESSFYPLLRGTYVGFNVHKPPFNNKYLRAAFSHALDRNVFPKVLKRGEVPTASWVPPQLKDFYCPDIGCHFNPELAREFLSKAGYPDGKDFPQISMLFPTKEEAKVIAEAIQAMWRKVLNVNIELENKEWKVYLNTLQKDPPHIFRMSWGADYPDPDTFMNLFTGFSGNNHGRWKNPIYDKLVLRAARTLDLEKRQSIYRKAQKLLLEKEVAIAPLYFNTQTILNKPWVQNFEFNPMDLVFYENISVK